MDDSIKWAAVNDARAKASGTYDKNKVTAASRRGRQYNSPKEAKKGAVHIGGSYFSGHKVSHT